MCTLVLHSINHEKPHNKALKLTRKGFALSGNLAQRSASKKEELMRSKLIRSVLFPVAVLIFLAGCRNIPVKDRKEANVESELYIEIIETEKGTHRFGIAHPGADKTKLETAEVDLPPDGVAHPITLDGHKITVYCRYTKKPNKRMKSDQ